MQFEFDLKKIAIHTSSFRRRQKKIETKKNKDEEKNL